MTYMRIASDTIQKRGQDGEPRVRREYASGYYFTLSKWQGMAYISDRLIVEDCYVDPFTVFPAKAKSSMFYGQRHGLIITAMQYKDVTNAKKGALAMVKSGEHVLGFYAVRYD